jgi:hypothetical protein
MVAHCKPTDSVTTSHGPTEPEHASTSDGPPPPTHLYNDPSLSALAFLHAVVHDDTTSLHHRMRAAELLLGIDPNGYIVRQGHAEPTLVRIGGIH